eukprot:GAHX01009143.1.p2 GENE.GAHX01009143.1~~GAHX01009143.1.p2  ORF type:complete len:50 (+),score=4.93 GAHX01009143.1:1-150(+)
MTGPTGGVGFYQLLKLEVKVEVSNPIKDSNFCDMPLQKRWTKQMLRAFC